MKVWDWVFASMCAAWFAALGAISLPPIITAILSAPDSSAAAAWAQAILSAAAILVSGFVAVWVSWWQVDRQRRLHDRQIVEVQLRRIVGLAAIFANAKALFADADVFSDGRFWTYFATQFDSEHFEDVTALLETVPLHEIENSDVAAAAINLRRAVAAAGIKLSRTKVRVLDKMQNIESDPIKIERDIVDSSIQTLEDAYTAAHSRLALCR